MKFSTLLNIILATFLLTALIYNVVISRSADWEPLCSYDPWVDFNDDGIIDVFDKVAVGCSFGSEGTPINKTAFLLELQDRVEAVETRIPKKGYLSVSPEAFTPEEDTMPYWKSWRTLRGDGFFATSLQLPHGATLTNMTVYLTDMVTDGNVAVYLSGYNLTKGQSLTIFMASVETSLEGTPGDIVLYDDTIHDAQIDNQNCTYMLGVSFDYNSPFLSIDGVLIEYEYPL